MQRRHVARAIVYRHDRDVRSAFGPYSFLLLKNGYWQNPQGGIEPGEQGPIAAGRETWEEARLEEIVVHRAPVVPASYEALKHGRPIRVKLRAYLVWSSGREEVRIGLSEDEHRDYGWFSYESALARLTRYPEQRTVFERACRQGSHLLTAPRRGARRP